MTSRTAAYVPPIDTVYKMLHKLGYQEIGGLSGFTCFRNETGRVYAIGDAVTRKGSTRMIGWTSAQINRGESDPVIGAIKNVQGRTLHLERTLLGHVKKEETVQDRYVQNKWTRAVSSLTRQLQLRAS